MTEQDIETRRARDLEPYHRRTAERRAKGLCLKCGKRPPAPHRSQCEPCAEKRRPADRARHHRRSAERAAQGLCPKCGKRPLAPDRTMCGPCGAKRKLYERDRAGRPRSAAPPDCACAAGASRKKAKNARGHRRYVRRRVRGLCIDCAAPAQGAARCPECARRSYLRSDEHRGLPILPPRYAVIEIATGADHGTWDSMAEVAVCLAFARLSREDVEVISDVSPMAAVIGY